MSVRKSLGWAFSGQLLTTMLSFAGSVVLARLLSPREMGIYAIALATAGVVGIVTSFGTQAYVVRETALTSQKLDTAFTAQTIIALVLGITLYAVSFLGSHVLGDPGIGQVLRLLALTPLISIIEFRPSVMLQRDINFKVSSIVALCSGVINLVLIVVLAGSNFSYMSPAYAGLASGLIGSIVLNLVVPQHFSWRLSLIGWRPMVVFGLRMMSVSGVSVLAQRVSEVILGHMLGLATLGLYSRASSLANLIFFNIYGTATRVMFTKLSRDYRERGVLRDAFIPALSMILAVMWPIVIGLAITARPAMYILYGEKWLGAALPLSMLMVALFFTLSFGMNWELFVLRDETAKQTKYEVIRSILGCIAFCFGCLFNIAAATLGRVLDSFLGAVFYFPKMNRLAGTTSQELTHIYVEGLKLTAAAASPALLLMIYSNWDAQVSIGLLACSIAAGVALWGATLYVIRHPLLHEMRLAAGVVPVIGPWMRRAA